MADNPDSALVIERLAASLAHALSSPLSLIRGRLDLLFHDAAKDDVRQSVQQLQDQIQRIVEILGRAQAFGKQLRPPSALVDLESALSEFEQTSAPALSRAGIELTVSPAAAASPGRISKPLLRDVLRGACAFLEAKGRGAMLNLDLAQPTQGLDCLRLELRLAAHAELASTRHALLDPWLEEPSEAKQPTDDALARLELALALGALQNVGGWYERSQQADHALLTLFIPLRS